MSELTKGEQVRLAELRRKFLRRIPMTRPEVNTMLRLIRERGPQ